MIPKSLECVRVGIDLRYIGSLRGAPQRAAGIHGTAVRRVARSGNRAGQRVAGHGVQLVVDTCPVDPVPEIAAWVDAERPAQGAIVCPGITDGDRPSDPNV